MATKRKRVMLVLTDDMHAALNRVAELNGATLSGMVRLALARFLAEQGEDVDWVVTWGGVREKAEDPAA